MSPRDLADVVEQEVHQAEAARARDDLVAMEGLALEERLLVSVERPVLLVGQEIVCGQEEPARSTSGGRLWSCPVRGARTPPWRGSAHAA